MGIEFTMQTFQYLQQTMILHNHGGDKLLMLHTSTIVWHTVAYVDKLLIHGFHGVRGPYEESPQHLFPVHTWRSFIVNALKGACEDGAGHGVFIREFVVWLLLN